MLTPQYLGYGRDRMEQMVPCGGVFSSPTVAYCGRRPRCALLEAKPLWLAALAWSAFVGRIENFGACKRNHSHPSHHFAWEKYPLSTRLLQHRRLPLPLSPFLAATSATPLAAWLSVSRESVKDPTRLETLESLARPLLDGCLQSPPGAWQVPSVACTIYAIAIGMKV